jgi:hypothetical protein
LAFRSPHRTFPVDPEGGITVRFLQHMIVVGGDGFLPLQPCAEDGSQYGSNVFSDLGAIGRGKCPRPSGILKVGLTLRVADVERSETRSDGLRVLHVMVADRRSHRTRSAVNHQPQSALTIFLQLAEVIAAAQGRELEHSLSTPCRLEFWVTKAISGDLLRSCNGQPPIPASGRHGLSQPCEYLPGRLRVGKTIRPDIKGHG